MKVTKIETIHVLPRWLFVLVHTDAGITGLGEATLEGRSQTVETCIAEIARYLVGQDPLLIERHWQHIFRGSFYRGGPVMSSALSGIDIALWDIAGKHYNVPIHALLGGRVRDKLRMYGWVAGEETGDYIDHFKTSVAEEKFTVYKLCPVPAAQTVETPAFMDRVVEHVRMVREAVGSKIDIGIDFHGRVSKALAKRLIKRLEPFDPMFIEEPVLPGNTDALVELAQYTSIPIATGERLFTRWDFQDIIARQAAAILQPDVSHCGGISELRRISAMAEPKDIGMAPHCPLGPIALAACMQVDAVTPNFLAQEHLTLGEGYLKTPFVVKEGFIDVPMGPGLGIELDMDFIESKKFAGDWPSPVFSKEDGSFAEW